MKVNYFIYVVFIILLNSNIAKSEIIQTIYELKLEVLGLNVKIGQINSTIEIDNDAYTLKYDLKSENLVELISPTNGVGKINGSFINSIFIPLNYNYTYERKGITKSTKIEFLNSNVINYEVNPPFEKSKLTPINDSMLLNVIDPSTAIILMGDYDLNKNCTIEYRIFDGKRRYDLIYTDIKEKGDYTICTLQRRKLGGFKINGDDSGGSPFVSAEQIDAYFIKKNNIFAIDKFITKNKSANLIIDVIIQ